jgi:ATP-dependent DNA helicase RecQ
MSEKMPKKQPKEKKADTKEETYLLYKQGKTVTEIANERKLTEQTISGHLAYYVQQGLIPVTELVAKEKLVLIEPVLEKLNTRSLIPIKEKLGDNISYGEIRITVAWKEFEKTKNFTPT